VVTPTAALQLAMGVPVAARLHGRPGPTPRRQSALNQSASAEPTSTAEVPEDNDENEHGHRDKDHGGFRALTRT